MDFRSFNLQMIEPYPQAEQDLLDAAYVGLSRDRERRKNQAVVSALVAKFDLRTAREHAILTQVAAGRLNSRLPLT